MLKVILADDDSIVRIGMQKAIPWKELGAEIVCLASNGKAVWDYIQSNEADVVISDIKMPEMDGLELAEKIWTENCGVDMILISAYSDFQYAQKAIRYNVKEYLTKPIDYENLNYIQKIVSNLAIEKKVRELNERKNNFDYLMQVKEAIVGKNEDSLKEILGIELGIEARDIAKVQEYYIAVVKFFEELGFIRKFEYMNIESISEQIKGLQDTEQIKQYVENIINTYFRFATIEGNRSEQICDIVEDIISKQYSNPVLNIGKIADELGLDAQYLGAIYKKNKNVSIIVWMKEYRLKKSMELLETTNFDIKDISEKVGFNNYRYFTTEFKKFTGISPSDFRIKKRERKIEE